MAKVEYVDLLPAENILYYRGLTAQDRFTHARVTRKVALFSRKKKQGLSARSLLPQIAEAWNLFSDAEKLDWKNAGAEMNLNGWRLFVQDKTIRIINDLAGNATPLLLHQSWLGNLKIESPATELKIAQLHPRAYWVSKKVYGKKGMYEPVLVTEDFALPLKISLNYKSEFDAFGFGDSVFGVYEFGGPIIKFYADVWSSYQGSDIHNLLEIDLGLTDDWQNKEVTLTNVAGYVVGYALYFYLKDLTGNLYIDNIKAEHSGQNWVRDPFCKDILQGFTRAFYQIPKHWAAIILPSGSMYDSIYKDF